MLGVESPFQEMEKSSGSYMSTCCTRLHEACVFSFVVHITQALCLDRSSHLGLARQSLNENLVVSVIHQSVQLRCLICCGRIQRAK